jgi:hypothetical protein
MPLLLGCRVRLNPNPENHLDLNGFKQRGSKPLLEFEGQGDAQGVVPLRVGVMRESDPTPDVIPNLIPDFVDLGSELVLDFWHGASSTSIYSGGTPIRTAF